MFAYLYISVTFAVVLKCFEIGFVVFIYDIGYTTVDSMGTQQVVPQQQQQQQYDASMMPPYNSSGSSSNGTSHSSHTMNTRMSQAPSSV